MSKTDPGMAAGLLNCLMVALFMLGCSSSRTLSTSQDNGMPEMVAHAEWEIHPPLGYDADATRRNLAPGDSLEFRGTVLAVKSMAEAANDMGRDSVRIDLVSNGSGSSLVLAEGSARIWNDIRIAVIAIHLGEDELGKGLAEFELAVAATVPEPIRSSTSAGGPGERLRIRHTPTHVTLHHSGSATPLTPEEDPLEKLRNLQAWGESDRGWWDVPYHFLIDLEGTIYEGRSYEYMGETNTRYDPRGHILISVLGNYNLQEPASAQLRAIEDLMAWSATEFGIPLDRIQGHSDVAETACPGDNLRKYLRDGSFRRAVELRLRNIPG